MITAKLSGTLVPTFQETDSDQLDVSSGSSCCRKIESRYTRMVGLATRQPVIIACMAELHALSCRCGRVAVRVRVRGEVPGRRRP